MNTDQFRNALAKYFQVNSVRDCTGEGIGAPIPVLSAMANVRPFGEVQVRLSNPFEMWNVHIEPPQARAADVAVIGEKSAQAAIDSFAVKVKKLNS